MLLKVRPLSVWLPSKVTVAVPLLDSRAEQGRVVRCGRHEAAGPVARGGPTPRAGSGVGPSAAHGCRPCRAYDNVKAAAGVGEVVGVRTQPGAGDCPAAETAGVVGERTG